MSEKLAIYQIQPGDTMELVSSRIGMSIEQLRDFHNRYCEQKGLLWLSGFTGITKIIIPADFKHPDEARAERKKYLPGKYFERGFLANYYNVEEIFTSQDSEKLTITYTLQIDVTTQKINQEELWIAAVKAFNHKRNGEVPDDKMSSLELACMEAIAPVGFVISSQGNLDGLYNSAELLSRFDAKRENLEDFYIGEINEAYLLKFRESLTDEKYLFARLASSMLYQFLFPGMQMFHQQVIGQKEFVLQSGSFPVRCKYQTEADFSNDDTTLVTVRAKSNDSCSLPELVRGVRTETSTDEPLDGDLTIMYTLSKEDKQVEKIETTTVLRFDEEEYSTYQLNLVKR